ncbi:MAG: hypothetical protein ABII88_10175 [Candidatus Omnitrophota bacterium]
MEALVKLIIYGIIIVIWVISNTKRKGSWDEKLPDFSENTFPSARPRKTKADNEPQREGVNYQPPVQKKIDKYSETYERNLAARKKQWQRVKTAGKTPQPQETKPVDLPPLPTPETTMFTEPQNAFLIKNEKKQTLRLQSSIKEGIMWSIVLGPPRSQFHFSWTQPPIRR